jgi:hypothetical protein
VHLDVQLGAVVPVFVVVVVSGALCALAWLRSERADRRRKNVGVPPEGPTDLIDGDTSVALTIGAGTDHAWLARDRAARARAVTQQARRSRWD